MQIVKNARAKINLTLDVLFKRSDGYHELWGVMHSIALCDIVTVTRANDINVTSDIPLPPNNTAYKAASEFYRRFKMGAHINIKKNIPSQAGLGGASADAAAVLSAMSELYDGDVPSAVLLEMAQSVGADVPFCLFGGCAVAQGIGELLTPLEPLPLNLLIVKGDAGISTPSLFKSLNASTNQEQHPRQLLRRQNLLNSIKNKDICAISAHSFNALEMRAAEMCPDISVIKKDMLMNGASAALMTGSGSAVFGIFTDDTKLKKAHAYFDGRYPFVCESQTVLQ